MRCIILCSLLVLASSSSPVRDVDVHVVTDGGRPTVTLYTLEQTATHLREYPEPRTFVVDFGGTNQTLMRDHYIGEHLVPTDLSFGRHSTLWLWWSGYELVGRRLHLREEVPKLDDDYMGAACLDTGSYSCTFAVEATTTDQQTSTYTVSLFTSEDCTVLPPSLFTDVTDATLDVRWTHAGRVHKMQLQGPFVLGDEGGDIVVSHAMRHDYSFLWTREGSMHIRARDRIFDITQSTTDFFLTVFLLYAALVLLYSWTSASRSRVDAWLLLLPLMFLHPGNYIRLAILVYVVGRSIVGLWDEEYSITPEYLALETIWSITMILHDYEPNVTSTGVKMMLTSLALRDMQKAVKHWYETGESRPFFEVDVVLAVALLFTLFRDEMMVVLHVEMYTRYGLVAWPPAAFLTLLLVEISIHLR